MRPVIGITNTTRAGFIDNYTNAVAEAGGAPLILPILQDSEALYSVLDRLDGIIFTGGADIDPNRYNEQPIYGLGQVTPARDAHDFALLARCLEHHAFPVLGICRGIQLMNVQAGGSCYQALEKQKPDGIMHSLIDQYPLEYPSHNVLLERGSRLHAMYGKERLAVNSFHHQSLKDLGEGLTVTARAEDGVIEAVEREGRRFAVGVQWHPEMMASRDADAQKLFRAFIAECTSG